MVPPSRRLWRLHVLRCWWPALLCAVAISSLALAQAPLAPAAKPDTTRPATAATPADTAKTPVRPPSPNSGIRNKISAGDLLSAESMLEVYKNQYGEDGGYLVGLSWLARGALLLGDLPKARRYVADVRARCDAKLASGVDLEKDHDVETALGAAIEVEAQMLQRSKDSAAAADFVLREISKIRGPVALKSRLNKRLNLLTLTNTPAPELAIEDHLGKSTPPTLASLRGKPVVLFVWAEWCGDCKAQASVLAKVRKKHERDSLQVIALTRFYDDAPDRPREKARVDSMWTAVYSEVGAIPRVFSAPSMERYGGSSTPTFVFIDRNGMVRGYTPTRLTEAAFEEWLAPLLR
jgi:thiol-disulfide isomerase/thioredoxin